MNSAFLFYEPNNIMKMFGFFYFYFYFYFSKKAIESEGGQIERSMCLLIKPVEPVFVKDFERQKVAINRTEMRAG